MTNTFFDFTGGTEGQWSVIRMDAVTGDTLKSVSNLHIQPATLGSAGVGAWSLKGFTSNVRYAEKDEREKLAAKHSDLGRSAAVCAALIPIKKDERWWAMAQDERRAIFEATSHHTEIGLKYLPEIARKLYHCRDIAEPFDFLTWFEYVPEHSAAFEELVAALRSTEEWKYVNREVDIRLDRI